MLESNLSTSTPSLLWMNAKQSILSAGLQCFRRSVVFRWHLLCVKDYIELKEAAPNCPALEFYFSKTPSSLHYTLQETVI